ncbi:unnamed protein product [Cochlearia groenlandica]
MYLPHKSVCDCEEKKKCSCVTRGIKAPDEGDDGEISNRGGKGDEDEDDFKARIEKEESKKSERCEKAMNLIILNVGDHACSEKNRRMFKRCIDLGNTCKTSEKGFTRKQWKEKGKIKVKVWVKDHLLVLQERMDMSRKIAMLARKSKVVMMMNQLKQQW